MSTKPTTFNPPDHPTFSPSYSHISTVPLTPGSKLIFVAGQIGHDPATDAIPPTFAEQVSLALANVKKCLDAAGATVNDIVSVRQYVVDMPNQDYKKRAELYMEFMGNAKPPSTLIGVQALAVKELLF